tara:strand:- start:205 stop:897 length:693 start_codon:yes stop_codon:yes gene_type:complete
MASSYTDLGVELITTGEKAGLWGTITNTNLQIVEQEVGGYLAKSIAGGAAQTDLAIVDGSTSSSDARNAIIELTGSISGNQIVTIPNSLEKNYVIVNSTVGNHTVQFKTLSGTGPTFSGTDKGIKIVFSNGTNIIDVSGTFSALGAISTGAITATGHVVPGANDTYDLGASGNVWRHVYTGDLHLNNEHKTEGNVVDGSKGSWTLQEGSDDIFLINNKSNEKFRLKLEKI